MVFGKRNYIEKYPRDIETPRLYLKPYVSNNFQDWVEARKKTRSNLEPWEPLWEEDSLTENSFRSRVRFYHDNWIHGRGYSFLNWRRAQKDIVGGVSLTQVKRGVEQRATLGYWCHVDHLRQGFTLESVLYILDFAFHDLKLKRIEASCMAENKASVGLLEKAGFKHEGRARSFLQIQGEWRDHEIYAKIDTDQPKRL